MKVVELNDLDLASYLMPGDLLYWGEGSGEPVSLVQKLVEQRATIGKLRAFLGMAISKVLQPEHADHIRFQSYGALVAVGRLQQAGVLDLMPSNYSAVPAHFTSGRLPVDAVFVQLSPPGPDGSHSLGFCNAALPAAMQRSRVIIAEINSHVPWTNTDTPIDPAVITVAVHSDLPPPVLPAIEPGEADKRIAQRIAGLIDDGATLQYGIGGIPTALLSALSGHKNLGLHTGLFTDPIVDLVQNGVITNTNKAVHRGISVAAFAIGGPRLRDLMHNNPAIALHQLRSTHGAASLSQIDNLMAINSALEVDLYGQANAEQVGSRYVGTIGGQVDFMHAASTSSRGLSVIAMPATIPKTGTSRISARINGPVVTTARADVDVVVTEFGVADLRAKTIQQRAQALIDIAAPEHRDELASQFDQQQV
ncbi:MAG: acetyl-CoA hydrolase/transferase C-terminal domain-containing protein [Burkholderiaceae bacterium]